MAAPHVIKRDGRTEEIHTFKITNRLKRLTHGLDTKYIDAAAVAAKVTQGIFPGITTRQLDKLAAETCAYSSTYHPDWSTLAARIVVSDLHKQTESSFSKLAAQLAAYTHPITGTPAPLIAEDVAEIIAKNADRLDAAINYNRDFDFDFFGFKTLEKSYLLRMNGEVSERPQQMFMRVSVGIHKEDIEAAIQTYELMSQRYFTHATPTLFNAGTPRPQLSSCFLLCLKDDSIDGIYDTLKSCASISKFAGGIGLSIHNVRATGSYIRGTNGESNGIVPMLRVFNDTARYVDQGGGKRKGSFAIYLEPWHSDIYDFLDLKKNTGKDEQRARDLFYALWIPDLFMQRVEADGQWSLFCPNEAPGLSDVCGEAFKTLYEKYEREGRARKTIKAQDLWFAALDSQVETGVPYMLYKDAANLKSNQQNLGVIKSSNLCTEIIEYTAPDEIAVCNLASIALPMFVDMSIPGAPRFDFAKLVSISKIVTRNLNKVIDINYYPVEEARKSNMRHRPIGIGVQGLADAFALMKFAFESPEASLLNKEIFEAIYYGAVEASVDLAEINGPYETFPGSPASKGILQFDMWGVKAEAQSGRFDWDALKKRVVTHGMRNSLLLAPMPTASTAQILGNNESTEPFTANVYSRRVLAGEFQMVNKHLLRELLSRGLWTPAVRVQIIAQKGSVQNVRGIPDDIKELYKTVWEIKQKLIIEQAADRGAYICQSQSLNIHMAEPTSKKLTSMHFYSWKLGLKTGMYYLRSRPKADAIQFTVDQLELAEAQDANNGVKGAFGSDEGVSGAAGAPAGTPGKPEPIRLDGASDTHRPTPAFEDNSPALGKATPSPVPSSGPFGSSPMKLAEPVVTKAAIKATGDVVPGDASPLSAEEAANKEAILAKRRAVAKEEQRKLRENLANHVDGGEQCLNCGS